MNTELKLHPMARSGSGADMREWKHIFQYEVKGLPEGEEAWIAEFNHRWRILRRTNELQEGWTGDYKSADDALAALKDQHGRREIIGGGELVDHPGHWKITGRIEGKSETWDVLRKPDGTFWEIVGTHFFPPGGGNVRFDVGEQIVNEELVDRLETYYEQLQQKLKEQ
jgi:hypothetical protein